MSNLLQTGSKWLKDQRVAHMADPIFYIRDQQNISTFATVGSTVFETNNADDVYVESRIRDFLIPAANLVLDGRRIEPRQGDVIVHTNDDGDAIYYDVSPLGVSPVWEWSDTHYQTYRIHAKRRTASSDVPIPVFAESPALGMFIIHVEFSRRLKEDPALDPSNWSVVQAYWRYAIIVASVDHTETEPALPRDPTRTVRLIAGQSTHDPDTPEGIYYKADPADVMTLFDVPAEPFAAFPLNFIAGEDRGEGPPWNQSNGEMNDGIA